MQTAIYQSKYARHSFDTSQNAMFSEWFIETADMDEKEFISEIEAWIKATSQVKPEKIYDNCVNFVYPISPDEQVWMAHLLNPKWIALGVKKYAHIVPEEFITNLSVEQMFDEFFQMNLPNQFEISHFSDNQAAKNWLGIN